MWLLLCAPCLRCALTRACHAPAAQINAGVLGSSAANFAMLAFAASTFLGDVLFGQGLPTAVYMLKTAGGDLLAGKLDQKEWWLAAVGLALLPVVLPTLQAQLGATAAAAAAPLVQLLSTPAADGGFGRIMLLLFAIQLACELGDSKLERWTFFRHRYSFEVGRGCGCRCVVGDEWEACVVGCVLSHDWSCCWHGLARMWHAMLSMQYSTTHTSCPPFPSIPPTHPRTHPRTHPPRCQVATALLLAAVQLYPQELLVVQIDLVACLAYRAAGFALLAATSPATTRAIFAALFRWGQLHAAPTCLDAAYAAWHWALLIRFLSASAKSLHPQTLPLNTRRVYFWQRGTRMLRVRDPQVARAVLAASDSKVWVALLLLASTHALLLFCVLYAAAPSGASCAGGIGQQGAFCAPGLSLVRPPYLLQGVQPAVVLLHQVACTLLQQGPVCLCLCLSVCRETAWSPPLPAPPGRLSSAWSLLTASCGGTRATTSMRSCASCRRRPSCRCEGWRATPALPPSRARSETQRIVCPVPSARAPPRLSNRCRCRRRPHHGWTPWLPAVPTLTQTPWFAGPWPPFCPTSLAWRSGGPSTRSWCRPAGSGARWAVGSVMG